MRSTTPRRLMPVALGLALAWPALAAAQDAAAPDPELVAAGEKEFRQCSACHMVGEDAVSRVGPPLTGVIGRTAGTYPDYSYSDAMIEAGAAGLVWTPETLDPYLEDPRAHVPGTKMTFRGLRDEEDRQAIIAYLETFSEPMAAGEAEGGETAEGEAASE